MLASLIKNRATNNTLTTNNQYIEDEEDFTDIRWFSGIKSQQKCFDRSGSDQFFCVKQLPYNDKFTNTYSSFNNINTFLKFKKQWDGIPSFNELIREGHPCKEYYDIDAKMSDWKDQEFADPIHACLREFVLLRNKFGEKNNLNFLTPIRWDDLVVTEACNDVKLSLHIIVKTHYYIPDTKDHKILAREFRNFIKLKHPTSKIDIDLSVYNTNSLMRCVGCCKIGDPDRIFKPYGISKKIKDQKEFYVSYVKMYNNQFPDGIPFCIPKDFKEDDVIKEKKDYPKLSDKEELQNCREIVTSLAPHRHEYTHWFAIGSALFNTLNGSLDGLELFIEFSSLDSSSFDEDECVKTWNSYIEGKGCSKGTLIHYFREDNQSISNKIKYRKR